MAGLTMPERITRVETLLEQQAEQIKDLREQVDKLGGDVGEIKELLTQTKGGWKVLLWIASAAGVIVSAVGWALEKVWP